MTTIKEQIEQEAKELAAVPKIPVKTFTGAVARCQVCGTLVYKNTLADVNPHVTSKGGQPRMACEVCCGRKR
jgi:hypothetical protein